MKSFSTLLVEREGPVGWLIFNRPQSGNAMDALMLDELESAWRELDEDPAVRVIVNTGEGGVFQTGLDVVQLSRDPDALRKQSGRTRRAELRLTSWQNAVWKPVIAAVNGMCVGGGLHFVADADIVLAASDATFLDTHVSVGQVAAYELIGLARRMPFEAVLRMALVGRHERMSADRALALGMISQVVDPPERLREEAQALAEKIARNSPPPWRPPSEPCGERSSRGSPTPARPGPTSWSPCGGIPTRSRARGLRREAGAAVGRIERTDAPTPERMTIENRGEGLAMTYETLKVERHGPVGWLINNRPERLNAMNNAMRDEFAEAWKELDADPAVRVIVHTGEGKAFQTGADMIEIASDGVGFERYRESSEKFDFHFTSWHNDVWKPVITAVNGICAGGGFHWIADADIVIAASDATFLDPHVSVGQVAAYELIGLARRMPFEAVLRMALVGRHERMSADRALALGMISQVVDPPERLREEAQALAEKIARNSPPPWRPPSEPCGERSSRGSPTPARPGPPSWSPCGGIPTRSRARRLRREAGAAVGHDRGVRSELIRGSASVEFAHVSVIPLAELWRRVAVVSGIDATYGAPFGALGVVPVPGAAAPLFAEAHQRVHGARAAAHRGDGNFWLPGLGSGAVPHRRGGLRRGAGGRRPRTVVRCGSRASHHPGSRISLSRNRPCGPASLTDNWLEPADETVEAVGAAATVRFAGRPGRHPAHGGPGAPRSGRVGGSRRPEHLGRKGSIRLEEPTPPRHDRIAG